MLIEIHKVAVKDNLLSDRKRMPYMVAERYGKGLAVYFDSQAKIRAVSFL